jgi:hypothetical protein
MGKAGQIHGSRFSKEKVGQNEGGALKAKEIANYE